MDFPFNNNLDKKVYADAIQQSKNTDYVTEEIRAMIALVQTELHNTISQPSISPEELNRYRKLSGLIRDHAALIELERSYQDKRIKQDLLLKKESAIDAKDVENFILKVADLTLDLIPADQQLVFISRLQNLKPGSNG